MCESIVRLLIVVSVLRRFKMNVWLGVVWEVNMVMVV